MVYRELTWESDALCTKNSKLYFLQAIMAIRFTHEQRRSNQR